MHTADGKFFPFDEQVRPFRSKKRKKNKKRTIQKVRRISDVSGPQNLGLKYINPRATMGRTNINGIGKSMGGL